MTFTYVSDERCTSPMGRISGGQTRWRVLVETWQEDGHYHGRFRFEADDRGEHPRESSPLLHGSSREDVLLRAYDLPEDRLRRVLHSLG